jgi:hypothetical protein
MTWAGCNRPISSLFKARIEWRTNSDGAVVLESVRGVHSKCSDRSGLDATQLLIPAIYDGLALPYRAREFVLAWIDQLAARLTTERSTTRPRPTWRTTSGAGSRPSSRDE